MSLREPHAVVAVLTGAAVLALIVLAAVARKSAGPNEVLVITGRGEAPSSGGEQHGSWTQRRLVTHGSAFALPLIHHTHTLDLSSRRVHLEVTGVTSHQGVPLNISASASVKIGDDVACLEAAASRFLPNQKRMTAVSQDVLSGAIRSVVSRMTVEQIVRNRTRFCEVIAEEAGRSLALQGLVLDGLPLLDVTDDHEYLTDLARPEAARVRQEAETAETNARFAAEMAEIQAEEKLTSARRELLERQTQLRRLEAVASPQSATPSVGGVAAEVPPAIHAVPGRRR